MNKRQTRTFAIVATAISAVVFLGMTVDSHRRFPALTHSENITPAVSRGQDVWHKYNCINCHTLFGEGAYYAPDLTKITQLRGEQYLKAYMRDPSKFYNEQRHRRLMPKQDLADEEISDLVAFLDWVSKVDNNGWPPRPILVTGSSIPGMDMTTAQQAHPSDTSLPPGARPAVAGEEDPIAVGERLFRTVSPTCSACHSIAPGVNLAGPSLAGIGARAEKTIASPDYKGKAKDVKAYIHESIVAPSAHLIAGEMYSANGVSFMPDTYGKSLKPEQIDDLVDYLSTLK